MAKPNAAVKLSGNLIGREDVIAWIRELSQTYSVRICTGGGEQINAEFKQRGWPIKFGPLGRITRNNEERQVARDVLENNAADVEDFLDKEDVNARVFIPVLDHEVGDVLSHVNGDVQVFALHNGYDKVFVVTLESRVEKKRRFFERMWALFVEYGADGIDASELSKIEVVGFSDDFTIE